MKRLVLCILFLCLSVFSAHAESFPLRSSPIPCSGGEAFVCGVHLDGEVLLDAWLVDTMCERGFTLSFLRNNDSRYHASVTNIPLSRKWNLQVHADDSEHCWLSVDTGTEKRNYDFVFVPDTDFGLWYLEQYSIQSASSYFEARVAGLWCVEMSETRNGCTQHAKAAWLLQNQCYNLILETHPTSISEARVLEKEAPVAAIAPQNIHDRVNLREGPSTNHPRIGSLYSGTMVAIEGDTSDEWLCVNPLYGATKKAYVHRSLLAFGEEIWNVPNATRTMRVVSSNSTVPVSFYPYHSSNPAGTIPSGIEMNIIGYYNDAWAIYGRWPGALYIETKYLR